MKQVGHSVWLVLFAIMIWLSLGARGVDPAKGGAVCEACRDVCERPLSYEDSLLDDGTDSYLLPVTRLVSRAAALEMARKLRDVHGAYREGYFGIAYDAHGEVIEGLIAKTPGEHVSSAEIRSLKVVRGALYGDVVVGLNAAAVGSASPGFSAAYEARRELFESVIRSMAARQQMRGAERLAICEVLAVYRGL